MTKNHEHVRTLSAPVPERLVRAVPWATFEVAGLNVGVIRSPERGAAAAERIEARERWRHGIDAVEDEPAEAEPAAPGTGPTHLEDAEELRELHRREREGWDRDVMTVGHHRGLGG